MKKWLAVIIGTASMAFGLDVFLIPAKIAAGGVSGVASILENVWGIKASVTVMALNIPLLIAAFVCCGKKLFLNSLLGSVFLSAFLEVFSFMPPLVQDEMLCAVAGGILVGAGMGIIFREDATTGGTDILAVLLQKIRPYLPISTLILMADGVIILVSGIVFKSFDAMIYACISLFISSKLIDSIVVGLDYAKEVTIISHHAPAISREVIEKLHRGVTGIKCLGLYSGKDNMMLVSVVKKNQIVKIKNIVEKHDKNAFVIVSEVKEVIGEGFNE